MNAQLFNIACALLGYSREDREELLEKLESQLSGDNFARLLCYVESANNQASE